MNWPTFASVVDATAKELALTVSSISNPFASADKNILQLNALLNALGGQLARQHPWTQLQRKHYFATVSGKNHYPLPGDFSRLVSGTVWNRTNSWKAGEGATPQEWAALKDSPITGGVYDVARVSGGRFFVDPEPAAVETLAFEYQSLFWVAGGVSAWAGSTVYAVGNYATNDTGKVYVCVTAGTSAAGPGPTGTGDAVEDNTAVWDFVAESGAALPPTVQTSDTASDPLWFDWRLLVDGLKLSFLRAKGFDTAVAEGDFAASLVAARGGDGMSPTLKIGRSRAAILLGSGNAPETGYGS